MFDPGKVGTTAPPKHPNFIVFRNLNKIAFFWGKRSYSLWKLNWILLFSQWEILIVVVPPYLNKRLPLLHNLK